MPNPSEFPLFEHWYKTMSWILDRCDQMPKHTRFTLSSRIVQLCLDIGELIIEAIYKKQRLPILYSINVKLEQLRLLIRLSKDRSYLSLSQYEFGIIEINKAGKMCGGWIKKQH